MNKIDFIIYEYKENKYRLEENEFIFSLRIIGFYILTTEIAIVVLFMIFFDFNKYVSNEVPIYIVRIILCIAFSLVFSIENWIMLSFYNGESGNEKFKRKVTTEKRLVQNKKRKFLLQIIREEGMTYKFFYTQIEKRVKALRPIADNFNKKLAFSAFIISVINLTEQTYREELLPHNITQIVFIGSVIYIGGGIFVDLFTGPKDNINRTILLEIYGLLEDLDFDDGDE